MTDQDLDSADVLKDLDAALQVEPSRAFADGVRARVTRSHNRNRNMWLGLAAAASVGLAAMTLWRPSSQTPTIVADSAAVAAPTQMATVTAPNVAPAPVVPAARAEHAVVRRMAPVASLPVAATTEPRLEVITNQGAVLREIWAAYQGRPLVAVESEQAVENWPTTPIVVEPIEVSTIVVSEIGRVPGPAGATPIVRRIDATKETR